MVPYVRDSDVRDDLSLTLIQEHRDATVDNSPSLLIDASHRTEYESVSCASNELKSVTLAKGQKGFLLYKGFMAYLNMETVFDGYTMCL